MHTVADLMSMEPAVVARDASLDLCAQLLLERRVRHLPVVDGSGVLVGVVRDAELFGRGVVAGGVWRPFDLSDRKLTAGDIAIAATTVTASASLPAALKAMRAARSDHLVVVERHTPVGILTEHDAVWLAKNILPVRLLVEHEQTRPCLTVPMAAPAHLALELMRSKAVRHLPVTLDGQAHRVVSLRDLIVAGVGPSNRLLRVQDVVRADELITTYEEATLRAAAALMVDNRIGCLPVVGPAGRCLGVITRTDLVEALVAAIEEEVLFPV